MRPKYAAAIRVGVEVASVFGLMGGSSGSGFAVVAVATGN